MNKYSTCMKHLTPRSHKGEGSAAVAGCARRRGCGAVSPLRLLSAVLVTSHTTTPEGRRLVRQPDQKGVWKVADRVEELFPGMHSE